MSINKSLILIFLLCSCASKNIIVSHNKMIINKLQPVIPNIELKQTIFNLEKCIDPIAINEKELCDIIKEMLITDVENLQIIRKAYSELIFNYTIDVEYYNSIYDKK